jgi:hypothetical protein
LTTFDERPTTWKQRTVDLSWREVDEEVILLDLRSATYLRLNPTGAFLWAQLGEGATTQQLSDLLADHFGVGAEQANHDATAFLESCASKGLVERQ